jgi:hypothetical protein
MNHGVVMFQWRDVPESRIWDMAMSRGQFVAIYTCRSVEHRCSTEDLWRSTFVRPIAEPPLSWFCSDEKLRLKLENDLQSAHPRFRHPTGEYGRYEPEYDEQFFKMCGHCSGYGASATAVLPSTASDADAMRLLGEIRSMWNDAWAYLHDRFCKPPLHDNRHRHKSHSTLSELIKPIHLREGWAYFLGFCHRPEGVAVFLCDDESDLEGLLKPAVSDEPPIRKADWLDHYGVIEKW